MNYMFLPLKRYFDFQGRSRRMEFWMFALLNVIVSIVFWVAFMVLFMSQLADLAAVYGTTSQTSYGSGGYGFGYSWDMNVPPEVLLAEIGPVGIAMVGFMLVYSLAMAIPALAVTVRRLHDTNRSGWWIFTCYLIYAVAFACGMLAAAMPAQMFLFGGIAMACGAISGILFLVVLVFMFLDGTRAPNRFGPDPKAGAYAPYPPQHGYGGHNQPY